MKPYYGIVSPYMYTYNLQAYETLMSLLLVVAVVALLGPILLVAVQ